MRSHRLATLAVASVVPGVLLAAPAAPRPVRHGAEARPAVALPVARQAVAVRAPRTVIAVTFEVDSSLYRVHPRTGHATRVGPCGASLTDVAARGATLYAISFGSLYTIN